MLPLSVASPAAAGGGGLLDTVRGKVVSTSPLNVRTVPSTDSQPEATPTRPGATVYIYCKVRAQAIRGNQIWYRLDGPHSKRWVTARYVRNSAPVQLCWTPRAGTMRLAPSVG
ncbi:SH3 domain-containing protein [Streptomyces sp. NPDC055709]